MPIELSKQIPAKGKLNLKPSSERRFVDAGRRALVRQLKEVGDAIEDGATEMAMIAAENVFDRRVSNTLAGEARAMSRVVRGLTELRAAVARSSMRAVRK